MPQWNPISVSGYHIREAGSTAAEELAFTLANGFAYVELPCAAGPGGRRVRAAALVLLQRPHRLLRGDRQVPRRPADLGPLDARALRRHATSGRCSCASTPRPPACSLTAQQPEINIARTAIEALAGVLGGTQSLHTNSYGRGARPAHREGGPHRPAHPADHRLRDRRRQRRRPARRLVVRRGAHRRDGAPGRGDLRPPTRARRGFDARGRRSRASRTAGSRARSPTPPTVTSASSPPASGSSSASTRFTEGDTGSPPAAHRSRHRRAPARAPGDGPARAFGCRCGEDLAALEDAARDPVRQPHAGPHRCGRGTRHPRRGHTRARGCLWDLSRGPGP